MAFSIKLRRREFCHSFLNVDQAKAAHMEIKICSSALSTCWRSGTKANPAVIRVQNDVDRSGQLVLTPFTSCLQQPRLHNQLPNDESGARSRPHWP